MSKKFKKKGKLREMLNYVIKFLEIDNNKALKI